MTKSIRFNEMKINEGGQQQVVNETEPNLRQSIGNFVAPLNLEKFGTLTKMADDLKSVQSIKTVARRENFSKRTGLHFDPTCHNGHNLKRYHRKDEQTKVKYCSTCKEAISTTNHYMKCGREKQCKRTYFCKRCVGCPTGHLVSLFRLVKPINPAPCLWCDRTVWPQRGFIRLCMDCRLPVCFNKCTYA